MILGQVGKDGDVVRRSGDPAERERVAGHLHHRRGHPLLGHHGQDRLQVGRFRRGQPARHHRVAHPGLHAADQAGQVTGHSQAGFHQVSRAGLAARAGDRDHQELGRGVAVNPGRHLAKPGSRIGDDQDRQPGGDRPAPAGRIGQHGDGASRRGLCAERRAVMFAAWQGDVQVAALDGSRVMGDPRDPAQRRATVRPPQAEQPGQPGERADRDMLGTKSRWHGQRVPLFTVR